MPKWPKHVIGGDDWADLGVVAMSAHLEARGRSSPSFGSTPCRETYRWSPWTSAATANPNAAGTL